MLVGGVRHEIDIFVDVDLGKGYKAIFIFECKNWEEKVGKNEIIVFSEKVDALQAQKGFFVAKSFTADAEAQAAKDRRLILLNAKEYKSTPMPFDFHFLHQKTRSIDVGFFQSDLAGERNSEKITLDITNAKAYLNGQLLNLHQYVAAWAIDFANEDLKTFRSERQPEGEHEFLISGERAYEEGEFKIDQWKIRRARVSHRFTATVIRPAVVSDFEIESRGRVLSLSPLSVEGGDIRVSVLALI